MARTSNVDPGTEYREKYNQALKPGERFIRPRIIPKSKIVSRKKAEDISGRSLLGACSEAWATLTDAEKQDWHDYDFHPQQHGWRRFVEEYTTRIILDISGIPTASQYRQNMAGEISTSTPDTEIKIQQEHPPAYYVYHHETGSDSRYSPVRVDETLTLPLELAISYYADLTATSPDAGAKFFARIRHDYQGRNLYYDVEIDIPLSSGWDRQTVTFSETAFDVEPKGVIKSYDLFLQLKDVTGTLLFDNLRAKHSGTNWARGPWCDDVARVFERGFSQIDPYWEIVTGPDDLVFQSVYPLS